MADQPRRSGSDARPINSISPLDDVEEAEEEQYYQYGEEEQRYGSEEIDGDEEMEDRDSLVPIQKMREVLVAMQSENLQLRKQNDQLILRLKQVTEQYVKDKANESEQMKRLKAYEDEFNQIRISMAEKLKSVEVQADVEQILLKMKEVESHNSQLQGALREAVDLNKKMKTLLTEKDAVIQNMQAEMKKLLSVTKEIGESVRQQDEANEVIKKKDEQIQELQQSMAQMGDMLDQIPKFEEYVKKLTPTMRKLADENKALLERAGKAETQNEQMK